MQVQAELINDLSKRALNGDRIAVEELQSLLNTMIRRKVEIEEEIARIDEMLESED